MFRKIGSVLALGAACVGAWNVGDAIGDEYDSRVPADEFVISSGYTPAVPSECLSDALTATLAALGAQDTGQWDWASDLDTKDKAWGLAWSGPQRVILDTSITCDRMPSVVTHEWVHLVVGEIPNEEIVADCVAARLRPVIAPESTPHSPYLDQLGSGCSASVTQDALEIISQHGL